MVVLASPSLRKPEARPNMTTIILPRLPTQADSMQRMLDLPPDCIHGFGATTPKTLWPNTPYMLGERKTDHDRLVMGLLSQQPANQTLGDLSLAYGSENTRALAELTRRLREAKPYGVAGAGAAASVYAQRMDSLGKAIQAYQHAAVEYHRVSHSRAVSGIARAAAQTRLSDTKANLSRRFGIELNTIKSRLPKRQWRLLRADDERMFERIRRTGRASRLDVGSSVEATDLVRFAQHAKFLGNGLAVIDFGSRASDIYADYRDGGNWERTMFTHSLSFATSVGTAEVATYVGMAALELAVAATPVGWVLIVGGLAVAGAAAVASVQMNSYWEHNGGSLYDKIMHWLSSL
jgi:hypothetical protein